MYAFGDLEIDLSKRELRRRGTAAPVGSRGFEVLEALLRARSELVNKYELMRAVWPGAVVEENTLHFHISSVRKALGEDRHLLKTVSGRGYRLTGNWMPCAETDSVAAHRDESAVGQGPAAAHVTNLPLPASPLIGRSSALDHLSEALTRFRVVTLTGPGGIGKSSLAMELGRGLFPSWRGDCWLVELASITNARLMPSAVTHVLGLRVGGDEISFEAVAHAIGGKKLLLILDNCEHLIGAAAQLAQTIVTMCRNASVLATSREGLRIEGEYVYHVPPLDVPPGDSEMSRHAREYSAVQLFLARMDAVHLGHASDRDHIALVAAICRRLDGIPLAIEFAAARSTALGVEEVAARLDDRFRLLTGGHRTALARHQTLRATLDWSYELLSAPERCLLRRLAIFVGGFTLDAAIYLMQECDFGSSQVVEGIANLIAKSLVAIDGSSPRRWRLLETVRAYALEKASEAGEVERTSRFHAMFFQKCFSHSAVISQPGNVIQEVDSCSREMDNVRAALDWCFSASGDDEIGVDLTAGYAAVWLHHALMTECRDRTRVALCRLKRKPSQGKRLQMELYIALGTALVWTMGSIETTMDATTAGLGLAKCLDDREAQLRGLWALWLVQFNTGGCRAAQHTAEQFCALARRKDDATTILVGQRLLGATLQYQGRQREAKPYFERVVRHYIAPADQHDKVWFHYDQRALARAMLARILWLEGFIDQATEQAERSVEEAGAAARGLSLLYPLAWTTCPLMLMTGNLEAAENAIRTLKDVATRHNAAWWKTLANCLEAKLLIKRGDFDQGIRLLQTSLRRCEQTGWTVCYPEFLGTLGEGLAGLRQLAESVQTIDLALTHAARGGERWYVPELLRVKAEILIEMRFNESLSIAEGCLQDGLNLARKQGAMFWELRCAMAMARLKLKQKLPNEAQECLAPVYEKFTEGFDTADLRASRTLLDQLSHFSQL
ncbi:MULTISPECIES: ATP-binding protein [Bradyrhizobium]|uniref:ATP-binding protein n=1 Tax=Bradyrhizobium TaxID=374 RepID=UPI001374845B|nr:MULTISPECIES: winged helix-turn-helix domain-containing protein [Bradyrhizobium]WOH56965.1 winged helix-turn-helix domain-containing protein [Bradyrhizobium sp. BWC-3-1]